MLFSGVQQSDSDIHIRISVLFQILFPIRLLQNTEQSSVPQLVLIAGEHFTIYEASLQF